MPAYAAHGPALTTHRPGDHTEVGNGGRVLIVVRPVEAFFEQDRGFRTRSTASGDQLSRLTDLVRRDPRLPFSAREREVVVREQVLPHSSKVNPNGWRRQPSSASSSVRVAVHCATKSVSSHPWAMISRAIALYRQVSVPGMSRVAIAAARATCPRRPTQRCRRAIHLVIIRKERV